MTRREERKLLEAISDTQEEVHENNIMLRQFISLARHYIYNANQENDNDFGRNVLANLLSGMADLSGMRRKL